MDGQESSGPKELGLGSGYIHSGLISLRRLLSLDDDAPPSPSLHMDDILELPDADVSRLQERGQSEGADDADSSADEEEGGLDWTKLP